MNLDAVKNCWKSRTVWVNGVILLLVAAHYVARANGCEIDVKAVSDVAANLGVVIPVSPEMTDVGWLTLGTTALGNLWLRFKTTLPLAEK